MEKKSRPPYLFGLLCIIPLVGAFVGIALILYGVFKYKDKWMVLIGVGGLLFTFVVYSFLYYDLKNSRESGEAFAKISVKELNGLTDEIEFYKIRNGKYPDNLEQLSENNSNISIVDPLLLRKMNRDGKPYYHYENRGAKYILFSVGIDGLPFTKDDIYPNLKDSAHYGFIRP